jgi:hypothetical protein
LHLNPLPFGSCLNIKVVKNKLLGLEIFNIHGQQVVPYQKVHSATMINTVSLPQGTYILRMFYDDMNSYMHKTLVVMDFH